MLPRVISLPWWVVVMIIGLSGVVSVSYTEGEDQGAPSETSQEFQEVEENPAERSDDHASSPEASLVQQLQARLKTLEDRERRLQEREARLQALKGDLERLAARQVKEAERLTKKAAELAEEEKRLAAQDPSLEHLIKVYEAMDPEEAAVRIEKMNERLALDILARIKDKKAAAVLAGVKPETAARLTEGLRTYRIRTQGR